MEPLILGDRSCYRSHTKRKLKVSGTSRDPPRGLASPSPELSHRSTPRF
jgi:hypothetical protein